MTTLRQHRFAFIFFGLIAAAGAILPLFLIGGCRTLQQTPQELQARETLRAMTRGGVLPGEDAVARIEKDFPKTTAGALARIVHARIKLNAKDFAGAATLLDSNTIRDYTVIGDYTLWMRGEALAQANRRVEARAVFEQLARDYPQSRSARSAIIRSAELASDDNPAVVPPLLKKFADADDSYALFLTAGAYDKQGDRARAISTYRHAYFFAPGTQDGSIEVILKNMNSNTVPADATEAITRADKLFAGAKNDVHIFEGAATAYEDAYKRFPTAMTPEIQLRRAISAARASAQFRSYIPEVVAALSTIPTSNDSRAEALFYLAQGYGRSKQWAQARSTTDDLRRAFPNSTWTTRAYVQVGQLAEDAKNATDASYFYRAAVNFYPGAAEVAPAQFYLAWQAHDGKNLAESSRLLTEHLANYADRNTDFRGKAAYWAARDSERSGKLAEARAIYQGLQARYDANWYGYLAKQRLDTMARNGNVLQKDFPSDSPVGRAVANLRTVTVAEETAGPNEDGHAAKADQLSIIGSDDWALEELSVASSSAPASPRVNLAIARIYRARNDNVQALNVLKRSYPDYSQMKPEEMRRDEWDIFYPLSYWDIITQESRSRRLDPFQVAGLIRQESVFNPRAVSSARAYGLMQVVVPTGVLTARKYGLDRSITMDSLFEPRLNIQLGTAYLRDQLDKYGRIEYVAAAYNAGPNRVVQWRASLPLEIDEWEEAVPFRETRLYIQGVVRNTMQYRRLYDEQGQFRPEVGARAIYPSPKGTPSRPPDSTIRVRRAPSEEEE